MSGKFNWGALLYAVLIIVLVILVVALAPNNKIKNKTMNEQTTTVVLQTNFGDIELALYPDKAPETVNNFLKLTKNGYYDSTKFHRVIKGFMIQGGDPYTKGDDVNLYGKGGPGFNFKDEINDMPLVRGSLAMANTGRPNTNGSQFFIITAPATPWLTGIHTVFGKVISGMEIVDKIEAVKTTGSPFDRPIEPVIINKVIIK